MARTQDWSHDLAVPTRRATADATAETESRLVVLSRGFHHPQKPWSTTRMRTRRIIQRIVTATTAFALNAALVGCSDTGGWNPPNPVMSAATPFAISLRSDPTGLSWIDRLGGHVLHANRSDKLTSRSTAGPTATSSTIASVDAAVDGEQRGLLGYVMIGPRSFVAFTQRPDRRLVVEELGGDGHPAHTVWAGTTTATKAIGGHLEARHGQIVLGLGELDGWARTHGSGAIVTLDPDGPATQDPVVLSDGWHNPFAFTVLPDGTIWVADNAPDGLAERIGRGDIHDEATKLPPPQRAPSAIAMTTDGRLAVCGLLDGQVDGYTIREADSDSDLVTRTGTLSKACATGLTVDSDGSLLIAGPDGISRSQHR